MFLSGISMSWNLKDKMDYLSSIKVIICIWSSLIIKTVYGSNSTRSTSSNDDVPKIATTIAIIIVAVIIAIITAKIADMCYDRSIIRDDSSDISDHTKSLIRARIAIMQMKKKKKKPSKKETVDNTKSAFNVWSSKSKPNHITPKEKSVVINVEEAKENGIVTEPNNSNTPRVGGSSPRLLKALTNGMVADLKREQSNVTKAGVHKIPNGKKHEPSPPKLEKLNTQIRAENKQSKTENTNTAANNNDPKRGKSVTFKTDVEIESLGSNNKIS